MKEKDFQRIFGKWIRENELDGTAVFELKICKGKSIPFNALAKHQKENLLHAKHEYCYHKINDAPIYSGMKTRFTNPKPFDCFVIKDVDAYVAIWFYVPYQSKKKRKMVWIDIDIWCELEKELDRKSIPKDLAFEKGIVKSLYVKR